MLDPKSNIGIMRSAPGYKKFNSFCAEIAECDDEIALTSNLILEDGSWLSPTQITPTQESRNDKYEQPSTTDIHTTVHIIPTDDTTTFQREESTSLQREVQPKISDGLEPKSQREDSIVLDGIESLPEMEEPAHISDQGLLLR